MAVLEGNIGIQTSACLTHVVLIDDDQRFLGVR